MSIACKDAHIPINWHINPRSTRAKVIVLYDFEGISTLGTLSNFLTNFKGEGLTNEDLREATSDMKSTLFGEGGG